jgi:acetylornithine deacetylase/succinyl-diaminopimelate desuccinylase-like protein
VGNVHRPNEHTLVSQLALARDVYRHTVQRLCIDADSEVTRL